MGCPLWVSSGAHVGPAYGQPTWAPRGARGQKLLGPNWSAHVGPMWQPMWAPRGTHMDVLAGRLIRIMQRSIQAHQIGCDSITAIWAQLNLTNGI